jgi:hypothetical protein
VIETLQAWGGAASLIIAQLGAASSAPEPITLDYGAARSCPDRSVFLDEIRSRTNRLRDARPGEAARVIEITVTEAAQGVDGLLRIRDPGGSDAERAVHGASCPHVVSALALIVALAIDPQASTEPRPLPKPSSPPAAPRDLSPPAKDEPPPSTDPPAPGGVAFGIGAQGSVHSAVAPDPLLAFGGYLKLESRGETLPGASAKLAVEHGEQTARVAEGGGEIVWTSAHLDGCPWGFRVARTVSMAPCVAVNGGLIEVTGIDTPNAETARRNWLSLGALLRIEALRLDWMAVDSELGVAFPLVRDRYFLRPSTTVHEVPLVEIHAGLSIGVLFE